MKRVLVITFFCISLTIITQSALAQRSGVGLGAMINSPTGLSIKGWVDENIAIDGALSFNISDNFSSLYLHADLLYHGDILSEKLKLEKSSFRPYYGAGLRIILDDFTDDTNVGVRVPFGLSYSYSESPISSFFEIVPTFDVAPEFRFAFAGAIGVRYYLN